MESMSAKIVKRESTQYQLWQRKMLRRWWIEIKEVIMRFDRAIKHLAKDLEQAQEYVRIEERSIVYHTNGVVQTQKKMDEKKLEVQEISKELYLLQQIRVKK